MPARVSLCGCLREPVLELPGEVLAFVRLTQAHYQAQPTCEALARKDSLWRERRP